MNHLVMITDQKAVTTSIIVAEAFEKEHRNVLRTINNLECSEEFNRLNFEPVSYRDAKGELRPMYQITRDGFSFLAMGFTGRKAAEFKEKFIAAFNRMEQALLNGMGETKRVDVNMNHTRGITNPLGLDIRYTMDLTRIAMKPTPSSLEILQRITGVDLEDIIDRLPAYGGAPATVAKFVKDFVREVPGERVEIRRVSAAYLSFCSGLGEKPLAASAFGRELRRLCPGVTEAKSRTGHGGPRVNCYGNLTLVEQENS